MPKATLSECDHVTAVQHNPWDSTHPYRVSTLFLVNGGWVEVARREGGDSNKMTRAAKREAYREYQAWVATNLPGTSASVPAGPPRAAPVEHCSWCPEPSAPSPEHHPDGGPEHRPSPQEVSPEPAPAGPPGTPHHPESFSQTREGDNWAISLERMEVIRRIVRRQRVLLQLRRGAAVVYEVEYDPGHLQFVQLHPTDRRQWFWLVPAGRLEAEGHPDVRRVS